MAMPENSNLFQSLGSNIQADGNIQFSNNTQQIFKIYPQTTRALSTTVNNWLPPLHGAWQERSEEQAILNYLTDSSVRLVGVYGAGGFGKSALTAQVFRQAEGFSHKLWANFQEPTDFGTFGRWLIQELLGKKYYANVRELYERDTNAQLIVKTLNELGREQRQCLLVLDNLETLFQDENLWQPYRDFLAAWLGLGCDGTVMLTSQDQLDLPGSAWKWLQLKGLAPAQGIALLKEQGIQGSNEQLVKFVNKADGHPLLLQLAASWLQRQEQNELEPAIIYQLQHDDLSLLEKFFGQHRGDPETTVGKLLDISFNRLHPQWLQVLLWRLSVLRGSYGLKMVQVMVSETVDLKQVRQLARSSFIQEQKVDGEWQFEFLPLIGRYLQLRARTAEEEINGHQRAINYFLCHLQEWNGSIDSCTEKLEVFHHWCELGKYKFAAQVINTCYNNLNLAGCHQELLKIYQRLTSEWQNPAENEIYILGWTWVKLGYSLQHIGKINQSINAQKSAQKLFEQINFTEGIAEVLNCLGDSCILLGEYPQSVDFYNQSLAIYQKNNNKKITIQSLLGIGSAYRSLGDYSKAKDYHQQSLIISKEIRDLQAEAQSLINIGNDYLCSGSYQLAIDFQKKSLPIFEEIGDYISKAKSLGSIGGTYQFLGEYQLAIDFQKKYFEISKEISYRRGEADSLGNMGVAYQSLGEYQLAIDFAQQHYEISKEIGDQQGEATSLGNIGVAYQSLGEHQLAIDFAQQHYEISRELGDRKGEATSLGNIGNAYQSLGEHQLAIDCHHLNHKISREIGFQQGEINSLVNLGNSYYLFNNYQQAINFNLQALSFSRKIGDRKSESNSLGNLGNTYYSLGGYQQAIDYYQQAITIQQEIGDRRGKAISLMNKALVLAKYESRRFEALKAVQQARTIFLELELNYMVEKCDNQIYDFNRIIATESQLRAPLIELLLTSKPNWQKNSLPANKKWWFWFYVSVVLAIVLMIWRFKK
jgi:tetratricopeptide (TPR) repeat protein